MKETCHVIIPAAGVGKRFGGNAKKQFVNLGGISLLERCLRLFRESRVIDRVAVCLPPDEMKDGRRMAEKWKADCVTGGETRAESVYLGFQFLKLEGNDLVLIHDAVRPLASRDLVTRMIKALDACDAAVPILPVSDTVKRIRDGRVAETIDRMELGFAQTPQAFRVSALRAAYDMVEKTWDWTDEAMLIERIGAKVALVAGEKTNIKVTTPEDLRLAESYLKGA